MKIRIGENEYEAPFVVWLGQDQQLHAIDSVGSRIIADDIHSALNEIATLRQERDSLEKRVEELEDVAAEWCMKCDTLANWFDAEQKKRPEWKSTAVQDDLRKFRDILGRLVASKSKESPDEV